MIAEACQEYDIEHIGKEGSISPKTFVRTYEDTQAQTPTHSLKRTLSHTHTNTVCSTLCRFTDFYKMRVFWKTHLVSKEASSQVTKSAAA